MILTLIRHTRLAIAEGICYGQSDIMPADSFEQEGNVIRDKIAGLTFDLAFTSPLTRCKMLAHHCGFKHAVEDDRLAELHFGDWELMAWDDIHGEYASKWFNDFYNLKCPNGESMKDMKRRMLQFIEAQRKGKNASVLCFTHSGIIRTAFHIIDRVKSEDLFDFNIEYGGVYKFEI